MVKYILCIILIILIQFSGYAKEQKQPLVRNVILLIGDGMGPAQVELATSYRQLYKPQQKELALETILREGQISLVQTSSHGQLVTDSAAAATAMACGVKTYNNVVGLDAYGKPCDSILKKAHRLGKATGLVSNTRATHATPAGFFGHVLSRQQENELALQLTEQNLVDVILNGGARHFLPSDIKFSQVPECAKIPESIDGYGKREDGLNLIERLQLQRYTFVCSAEALNQASSEQKVFGLFTNSSFPSVQERRKINTLPSLKQMTNSAIKILSSRPEGFFLMVEGGQIDYAGHANDAGTLLKEILDFDSAVDVALKYAQQHHDTLVLVTADHETGGFGFSYRLHTASEAKKSIKFGEYSYTPSYLSAPIDSVFKLLDNQQISFTDLLEPYLDKIYLKNIQPEILVNDFAVALQKHTGYNLDKTQIKRVLQPLTLAEMSVNSRFLFSGGMKYKEEFHGHLLAQELSEQNFTTWSTGTHTAVPVYLFSYGALAAKEKFKGLIDNTDISKNIESLWQLR